jgi:hypothetical protein
MDILRLPPLLRDFGAPRLPGLLFRHSRRLEGARCGGGARPRFPRLKEWAYAGMVFIYTGAVASRLAVGDRPVTLVGPIIFIGLVAASWSLRPPARSVLRLDKQRYTYAYFPFAH